MTDRAPIAGFFTRIRNAIMAKHVEVNVPHSNQKIAILKVLQDEENWKTKYPNVSKKIDELETRVKQLEGD